MLFYNQKAVEENRSERVIDELLKMDKEDAENIFSSDKLRVEEMQYLSVKNVAKLIENIDNCDILFHTHLWFVNLKVIVQLTVKMVSLDTSVKIQIVNKINFYI